MSNDKSVRGVINGKTNKLTKRRLLKKLTAAGVSIEAAHRLTVDDVRAADSDQMVVSLDIDGNSKYYVPSDWYDRVTHMFKVKEKVQNSHFHKKGIAGIAGSAGRRGGENPHITAFLDKESEEKEKRRGEVPERKDGVEITIEERDRPELAACSANCNDYDNVNVAPNIPGGVMISIEGGGCGTTTPLAIDISGTYSNSLLMTNSHVANCTNNTVSAYHPDKDTGVKIGEVVKTDDVTDVAIVELESDMKAVDEVAQASDIDNGNRYEIGGTLTRYGVATFQNEGWYIHKEGTATCHTAGTIDYVGGSYRTYDCPGAIEECVEWGTGQDMGDGDSGSIAYGNDPNSTDVLASNINSVRYPLVSTAGSAGYYIKERNDVYWNDGFD